MFFNKKKDDNNEPMAEDRLAKVVRFPKLRRPQFFQKLKNKKQEILIYSILSLMGLYVVGAIVFGIGIYKFKWENKPTRYSTYIYPFPAAMVNGQPIWVKNICKQIGFVEYFSEKTQQEIPSLEQMRLKFIDQSIENTIIAQQARRQGIRVSKKEFDVTYSSVQTESGGKEKLLQILKELYGMKENDFKQLIYNQALKQKVQEELLVQVKASHILIQDEATANDVLKKIQNGEISFADAAKQYSQDTGSKDNGGDLGWFGKGEMDTDFENAAFALSTGQTTQQVVKSKFGFHIIQVTDKKGKLDMSFDGWLTEQKSKIMIWHLLK